MSEPIYKRCLCRNADGKQVGVSCQNLRRADGSWNPRHGTWYFALELPKGPNGRRRPRMRRGGFASREEAEAAREAAKASLRKGADPSVRLTTSQYLTDWLAGRVDLKPTTRRTYSITISTYLIPLLGHVQLSQLKPQHIADAFSTIREWNDALAAGKPVRKHQRRVGPAAMQRIRDALRSALKDAVTAGMIEFNPAERVRMEALENRRPAIWTPERTDKFWADYQRTLDAMPGDRGDRRLTAWRTMSLRPSPVMIWTPEDLGRFLDGIRAEYLSPLFELAAATGMRRGELCGLRWADVDLNAGVLHVTTARVQAGWQVVEGGPKSEAGHREITLLDEDVQDLRAWKARQGRLRLSWGSDWQDTGLVFTRENGAAWHPADVSDEFGRLALAAHLPPVRLHDIRHAHLSQLFATDTDARIIQERAGHAGAQTSRDYAAIGREVQREAARRAAASIPRAARRRA